MSTRATYTFKDNYKTYSVYKHCDGYPEGALQWISNALPYAWELPRFEADDFAAAFIAGNKEKGGGSVYMTAGKDAHGDTQYHYDITFEGKEIFIRITKLGWGDVRDEAFDTGKLHTLYNKYVSKAA